MRSCACNRNEYTATARPATDDAKCRTTAHQQSFWRIVLSYSTNDYCKSDSKKSFP